MLRDTPHRTTPALAPLRGREAEWRRIAAAMARLATRRRSVVEVSGRPGIGRTRFLRELALAAGQAGCVVVTYNCQDDLGRPDLLHALTVPPGAKPVLIITDEPALLALMGEPAALDRLLQPSLRVSADAPVLWVTTRRRFDRPDEAGTAITTIDLGPLAPDAVALVAADLLGAPAGRDVLALLAAAAGHPDTLVELVTGLVDEGLITIADDLARLTAAGVTAPALPARSRERIHRRLDRVSTDARVLTQVVSVLGSASDLTGVARVVRSSVTALMPVVDEALASGLLVTAGERLAFAHELIRAEVAGTLSPAIRCGLRSELGLAPPTPGSGGALSDVDPLAPGYQSPSVGIVMNLGRLDPRGTQSGARSTAAGTATPGPLTPGPLTPGPLLSKPRAPAGCFDLTEREREIAGLVGEGHTNPEIAARLYITKDTVAYHLKSVFRKLGIARRTQLAGLVRR